MVRFRWSRSFVLVVLVVSVVMGVVAWPAEAAERRLLVTDGSSLVLVSPSGAGHRELAQGRSPVQADADPTGRRIAYGTTSCLDPCPLGTGAWETQLRVVNVDGTGDRALLTLPTSSIWTVDWSPDGEWIAFLASTGMVPCWGCPPPWALHLHRPVDGTHLVLGPASDLDWAPDGRRVAIAAGGAIVVADLSSPDAPVPLTPAGWTTSAPTWSPDGRRIAFLRADAVVGGAAPQAWVIGADGSDATALGSRTWSDVAWAPDSRTVATVDGRHTITLVNADGTTRRSLPLAAEWVSDIAWTLDGRSIAYVDDRGWNRGGAMRLARVDGSGDREIHRTWRPLYGPLRWV